MAFGDNTFGAGTFGDPNDVLGTLFTSSAFTFMGTTYTSGSELPVASLPVEEWLKRAGYAFSGNTIKAIKSFTHNGSTVSVGDTLTGLTDFQKIMLARAQFIAGS